MIDLSQFVFKTYPELVDFTNKNPEATLKDVEMELLVEFIRDNKGKYLFLKDANLKDANLKDADLIEANLTNTNLTNAYLIGANYSPNTIFPEGFVIHKSSFVIHKSKV